MILRDIKCVIECLVSRNLQLSDKEVWDIETFCFTEIGCFRVNKRGVRCQTHKNPSNFHKGTKVEL